MPPTSTFLPYSKDDKAKRPKAFAAVPATPRFSLSLLISAALFFVGAVGIVFATVVAPSRSPRVVEVSVFRCGKAEDTLRTFRSRSSAGGDDGLEDRPKLLGFVGVQTGFESADRRASLRSTWFPSDPEGLARFAYFKAAHSLFDAEFYVKADDDIYLRPDRLAILLAKDRAHRQTYIGCMKKGPVITDPKMKWYESSGHLIGNEYFLHAYGPIYALSAEVVGALAATKNDSLRMFSNEDVTVGSWMLSMDVNHEDNRALCAPKCTDTSIAVWDIPKCSGLCNSVEKMKALHKTNICSRSPTPI
ncbi:hypothetical protein J5N97_025699 [Dioscorea zingiberensis]|uniref:Hexosyltransferase n=1 Tax=Dioscorea zingiberensis TaxID=325984 RepID=A0A9D5H5W0_9LILI|nr:hypothetical protein J5N97_025699 [Dioscorea zingiberensis]